MQRYLYKYYNIIVGDCKRLNKNSNLIMYNTIPYGSVLLTFNTIIGA